MTPWTRSVEDYFNWWQSAAARSLKAVQDQPWFFKGLQVNLERYLQARQFSDRFLEEMWRSLRLPSLEEVTRLGERINDLESLLVEQEEQRRSLALNPSKPKARSRGK